MAAHPLLNIAIRAARRAGDLIVRSFDRVDTLEVFVKDHNEYVSEIDRKAEEDILETIRRSYPEHAFLAEESGRQGDDEVLWIIDPLDGTTNYLHGLPQFAVSIACQVRGRLEVGVIYDPMRQELYTAIRGAGAQLDEKRIRVSPRVDLESALIGTGFPYRDDLEDLERYIAMFRDVARSTAGMRRPGSAALDLAYVAAGRYDGFWETGLKPWDIAAGALMVQESGGIVTGLDGSGDWLETGAVLAASPRIHDALRKLLQPHLGTAGDT
jgi:myo-inositol-1(or 4)-monophosphatase